MQYVQVDYDDISGLAQQLEHHKVQTVICTIGMLGDDCSESQLNLIKAADQAHTVQRFITSEFGYMTREEYVPIKTRLLFTNTLLTWLKEEKYRSRGRLVLDSCRPSQE